MSRPSDQCRFKKSVVDLIAKRSGFICTNPDCAAGTSGPASQPDRSVIVGEACHIYGANPGSARFVVEMTVEERSDITNAIWLCCTCHKLIDSDVNQHPAELLFEWRRQHENDLAGKIGKAAALRGQVLEAKANPFKDISYLAHRIVLDKPSGWEYKLTLEILRINYYPILKRWRSLSRGLYSKPSYTVSLSDIGTWQKSKTNEMIRFVSAMAGIAENSFAEAWGPPGQPGSETEILHACDLFCDVARQLLAWEEAVRFATLPSEFDEYQRAFAGPGGRFLELLNKVPESLQEHLDSGQKTGRREVTIKIDLPEGWAEQCIHLFRTALAEANDLDVNDLI